MEVMLIFCIVVFIISIIGLYFSYEDAKKSKRKMEEFKNQAISGLLAVLLVGGIFSTCFTCNDDHYQHKKIDKGYTSDPDYTPTFDERGEYHNNGTGDRQIQYQGSREQRQDLDAIDEYAREHPGF